MIKNPEYAYIHDDIVCKECKLRTSIKDLFNGICPDCWEAMNSYNEQTRDPDGYSFMVPLNQVSSN